MYSKRKYRIGIAAAVMVMLIAVLIVASRHPIQHVEQQAPHVVDDQQGVIKRKLDEYNTAYPEIRFVHVAGGIDWQPQLAGILLMLGVAPDALDYEHPSQLREELLNLTTERLRQMMVSKTASATLFRVGQNSTIAQANLCVITLHPDVIANDAYHATQHMLDLPEAEMHKVHPARYLQPLPHLEFVMDHEAFHCLDSYFNGGAPQTDTKDSGEFNLFRRESVADAYALLMHIRNYGDLNKYARNIIHIRALWFSTRGLHCCTFETIREVMNYDHNELKQQSTKALIELAIYLRNKTAGDYDAFLVQRNATLLAAQKLRKEFQGQDTKTGQPEEIAASAPLIDHLINRYKYYYQMLFNDDEIPFEAPHKHDWNKDRR